MPKSQKPKKPLSKHYRGNNRGGYGNPPVSGQFKEGNCGGGRKRKQESLEASMRRMFGSKVTVGGLDGEPTDLSMTEAIALRVKKEILTGSPKLLEYGLKLAEKYGPEHIDEEDEGDWSNLKILEKKIIRLLLMKVSASKAAKDANGRALHCSSNDMVGTYRFFVRDDGFMEFEQLSVERYVSEKPE